MGRARGVHRLGAGRRDLNQAGPFPGLGKGAWCENAGKLFVGGNGDQQDAHGPLGPLGGDRLRRGEGEQDVQRQAVFGGAQRQYRSPAGFVNGLRRAPLGGDEAGRGCVRQVGLAVGSDEVGTGDIALLREIGYGDLHVGQLVPQGAGKRSAPALEADLRREQPEQVAFGQPRRKLGHALKPGGKDLGACRGGDFNPLLNAGDKLFFPVLHHQDEGQNRHRDQSRDHRRAAEDHPLDVGPGLPEGTAGDQVLDIGAGRNPCHHRPPPAVFPAATVACAWTTMCAQRVVSLTE